MSIRILHVVDTWAVGGLQRGLANLIERMDPSRFDHVICAMRPVDPVNAQPLPAGRVQVIGLSEQEARSRFQAPALTRKVREVRPNIVHTRNWGTFEALWSALRVRGCARVHSEHGVDWDSAEKELWRRILCRRLAFQMANHVVSVSHQLKHVHAQRTGFPTTRIEVIHNGVDSVQFRPDPEARVLVRKQLGIGDNEFCMGCVANLTPVKDHLTLFRAVARFADRASPWRLLVVGAGPELPKLTAFVNRYPGWKDRVLFLGRSNSVSQVLNAMDVYVLPSLTEGINNSLLEAMATGLAILATDTGGTPEVVIGGESGLLFPVGDDACVAEQLLLLQENSEWRRRLGESALSRVRSAFSIQSMVRKYESLYESLVTSVISPVEALDRV
jgi:sugar transferase (PEP-CTERM/EpsH1 system associated)